MEEARLPARLEVSGLIRATEANGGFGTVLHKGEPDAGTILVVIEDKQQLISLYERMPQVDGRRMWSRVKVQDTENKSEFSDYLDRRKRQDSDVWIVELIVADAERLILNAQ